MIRRKCKRCEDLFEVLPQHKGFVDICMNCYDAKEDVPTLKGVVRWENKHTPVLTPVREEIFQEHRRLTRRLGAGVTGSLCPSSKGRVDSEAHKTNSGTEEHALYYSPLGEKRHVK